MDFHTAVEHAIADIHDCPDPDGEAIHAALQLATHAWQLCDEPDLLLHWDMFGTGLQAAIGELPELDPPIIIRLDEQQLPDSEPVRRAVVRLTIAVADRLDTAAGDPRATANRRWAWSIAAARLRDATQDLLAQA